MLFLVFDIVIVELQTTLLNDALFEIRIAISKVFFIYHGKLPPQFIPLYLCGEIIPYEVHIPDFCVSYG